MPQYERSVSSSPEDSIETTNLDGEQKWRILLLVRLIFVTV
jgi:hypothetical protein